MRKRLQKGISLFISIMMVFGTMPIGVLAEDADALPASVINNESFSTNSIETSEINAPKIENDIIIPKGEETTKIDEASGFQHQVEENEITLLDGTLNDIKTNDANGLRQTSAEPETIQAAETMETKAVVNWFCVSNFTASKTSPQNINTSIKITAKATGGTGPYKYEFFYTTAKEPETNQTIQRRSSISYANFETDEAGTYTFYVRVTDKMGETCVESMDDYTFINQPDIKLTSDIPSSSYVDTKITLTANVVDKTGTAPFQYKFYYKLESGLETETIKEFSDENTADFIPDTAGVYTLYVDVMDGAGLTTTKSIEKYEIVAELSVTLESDKESPQDINTEIKLTAKGAGGKSSYQYKFYYILGGKTVVIKNFSKSSTANFTPSEPGDCTLYVDVKNASGKISTASIDYEITDVPVVNSFTTDLPSEQIVGTPIELTADASGGTGALTYAFSYKLGKDGDDIPISTPAESDNTATFTPTEPGTYTLSVTVTDPADPAGPAGKTATKTIENYKVIGPVIVESLTANKASEQPIGTSITLKAAGTGGKAPYQYEFYYKLNPADLADKEIIIQDYSTLKTANFVAEKSGSYVISVRIRDANGNISTPKELDADLKTEGNQYFVIVNTPSIDSFETEFPAGQFVRTDIELTADASGGTGPYTYTFSYQLGTAASDVLISQAPGEKNTATFTPSQAGTYILRVTVTDSATPTQTATKTITNYKVLKPVAVKSFTTNKASGQNIGTSIKLTAVGIDGKAPYQYQFSYTLAGEEAEVFRDYSTARTANFIPEIAGAYKLSVTIKDAKGNISTKDLDTNLKTPAFIDPFEIVNTPSIDSFETDLPSEQTVDTPIELIANASGGTGELTYEFSCKLGTQLQTGANDVISQVSGASTATFTPKKTGTYILTVTVTDEDGKKATKTITNYKVLNPVAVKTLTPNKSTGQSLGSIIILTAAGTGGKAPYQYQFSYQLADEDVGVVFRNYATARTANFSPSTAGDYTLSVTIKDANGNISEPKDLDFAIIDMPVISSFVTDLPSEQIVNAPIELIANASGGTGTLTYDFSYKLGIFSDNTDINQWAGEDNTATFTPTKAGTYILTVTVKDEVGKTATKTIANYKVLNPVAVKSFTTNKTPEQSIVGAKILLTAVGTGGKAPYQYKFTYTRDGGAPQVIQEYSTVRTVNFTPSQAGTYTLTVEIKDSKNRNSSQMQKTIEVN